MASFREVTAALEALLRLVRRHDPEGKITSGSTFAYAEAIASKALHGIVQPEPWTPFARATPRPGTDLAATMGGGVAETPEIWTNSRYLVLKAALPNGMIYLSIKRHDQSAIRSWRDLQRVKNELVGPECEGVEIFPAESRKMDEANQFHLWVNPDPSWRFALGDHGPRKVAEAGPGALHGQEPFEPRDPYGPEKP